jgi:hypothetical protein
LIIEFNPVLINCFFSKTSMNIIFKRPEIKNLYFFRRYFNHDINGSVHNTVPKGFIFLIIINYIILLFYVFILIYIVRLTVIQNQSKKRLILAIELLTVFIKIKTIQNIFKHLYYIKFLTVYTISYLQLKIIYKFVYYVVKIFFYFFLCVFL